MIMFITVCAIIVIVIAVEVVMDRGMRTHDMQNDGDCSDCKYLDYWNDGSPLCTKNIDGVCIPNGFKYREMEEVAE